MPKWEYEYDRETQKMRLRCIDSLFELNLEDSWQCMAAVIDKLMELRRAARIILIGTHEYEYSFDESRLLLEIAIIIDKIVKDKTISLRNVVTRECQSDAAVRIAFLNNILNELRYDPITAYKTLLREIRHTNIRIQRTTGMEQSCLLHYSEHTLKNIKDMLDTSYLIQFAKDKLQEHKDRALYRKLFHPTIRPSFIFTRYMAVPPINSEMIERYSAQGNTVEIYQVPGKVRKLYHLIPPEFRMAEEEYILLDDARRYLGKHEPGRAELTEPEHARENMFRISLDMLRELASSPERAMKITEHRLRELANILTRYTAGLGTLELLLQDEKIQDIAINSPIGQMPIFLFHADYMECETNIIPNIEEAESWATRFRLLSGRPLDEANPVLDTEISVPGGRARVAAITRTLSPEGLGFALRRQRDKPWTYPLFIKSKFFDAFSAGLMWFLIDGSRTILIAGTRSSGKTAFLSSCLVQIMPKIRIITVEDTLELPVIQLRELGYNIEQLKSRSVITRVETEIPAEDALRTSLRLGDSSLIVGEVRSTEALALYEAMRIGALANVVAGTIHGASAYGVFDRVVNDLRVPPTSFKATDIVFIANMLRSPDGLHAFRRGVEITEVRKHWKSDPMEEGGFVNLMEYSALDDKLKPTKTLLAGESHVINDIASRVREWRGNWEDIWNNINLRAKILQSLVDYSIIKNKSDILEAPAVIESNSYFHLASAAVKEESGWLDPKEIYNKWYTWLKSK